VGVTISKKGSGVTTPVTASNKLFPEGLLGAYAFEREDGPPVLVSQPMLDRISVIGWVPLHVIGQQDKKGAAEMRYKKAFQEAVQHKRAGLRSTKTGSPFAKGFPKKDEVRAYIRIGPRKTWAEIRLLPEHDDDKTLAAYRLRIEWNPRKAGPQGMAELNECLAETALANADVKAWFAVAEVTRLDIAVDVLDAERADIYSHMPGETKLQTFARRTSGIETVNHHRSAKIKRRASLIVYDKRQERLDAGKTPFFGARPHVRIERSIAFTTKKPTVLGLPSQPDRLAEFHVRLLRGAEGDVKRDEQRVAAASVTYLGVQCAMKVLGGSQAPRVAELAKSDPVFWRTDLLWKRWPEALKQVGLSGLS
jgi:hypothetical protein